MNMTAPEGISQTTWDQAMAAQTNPVGTEYHDSVDYTEQYTLHQIAAEGGKISRVRVLAERWPSGWLCDVSYIHATLPDGRTVPVNVMVDSGALYGQQGLKARMIRWAQSEGVWAKKIGLLDEAVWSVLK